MLNALLRLSGIFVLKLVYGREYDAKASGKTGLSFLLSAVNCFWLLSLMFLCLGAAAKDVVFCLVIAVGYPLAIAIWAMVARKKQNKSSGEG